MGCGQSNQPVNWRRIRGIVFDVDGTLYDAYKLRRRLLRELLGYYLLRPWKVQDVRILRDFRYVRELRCNDTPSDLESAQYVWTSEMCGASPERVHQVVQEWIFRRPLRHLAACRYPGLLELIVELDRREIKTAFFSDYPAKEKLAALGLSPCPAFCATDINVNRLKPDPKSLLLAAQVLGVPVSDCLCIGDRDDRDGEAARRAGMEYLLLKRNRSRSKKTFQSYFQLIDEIRLMN